MAIRFWISSVTFNIVVFFEFYHLVHLKFVPVGKKINLQSSFGNNENNDRSLPVTQNINV